MPTFELARGSPEISSCGGRTRSSHEGGVRFPEYSTGCTYRLGAFVKFRRDVAISNFNDHRQALLDLKGLDRTKLGNEGMMTVHDTYLTRSLDDHRSLGDSRVQDRRAHAWGRENTTANMARGYI